MKIAPIKYNVYRANFAKQPKIQKIINQNSHSSNSLQCLANQNIAFCAKRPIVVMDEYNKLYVFDSILEASAQLGLRDINVSSVLKQRIHQTQGYTFMDLKEAQDKDGNISQEAIKKMQDSLKNSKTMPIYAIDYDGNIKRFSSQAQAAREYNLNVNRVSNVVMKETPTTAGIVFVDAQEIERRDDTGNVILGENGEPEVDYNTVLKQLKRFSQSCCVPFCTIDYLGNINRFQSPQDANDKSAYTLSVISRNINSNKPLGRNVFVCENDILYRDKFGKTKKDLQGHYIYDIRKINEKLSAFEYAKAKPIKVKDLATGIEMKFDNSSHAAKVLGMSKQLVHKYLKNPRFCTTYLFDYIFPTYLNDYNIETWSQS